MSTSLKTDIENMLEGLERPPEQDRSRCIYSVPKSLRTTNDAAYTPKVISIGPLHHGKGDLHKMETHKLKYVSYFLKRNRPILGQLLSTLGERETEIRSCYDAGPLEPDSDKFLKIILVDAIFIIQFFLELPDDYALTIPRLVYLDIYLDLILLENQLPFPLLKDLYDLYSTSENKTFLKLASDFFSHHNKQNKSITMPPWPQRLNIKHFTDLIRFFYLRPFPDPIMFVLEVPDQQEENNNRPRPAGGKCSFLPRLFKEPDPVMFVPEDPDQQEENNDRPRPAGGKCSFLPRWFKEPEQISKMDIVPSATELHQAGVKLKMGWLDINYKEGVLEIPCLELDDSTEITFRNMMAFEQCYYPSEEWIICAYVGLFDDLINTNKDVDLLVENGIIYNCMGSTEAVTQLFNKFSTNIIIGDGYYSAVQEGLIRYYKVPWHKSKATFKHDYFRTPWSTASTIAAVILLLLTLIQTICSILSVIKA